MCNGCFFSDIERVMGRSARFANQTVMIRLSLHGCTNRPFYHFDIHRAYRARNAEPIDKIGTYDPMPNDRNEKLISINFEKLHHWIRQGALPTKQVSMLLGKFIVYGHFIR